MKREPQEPVSNGPPTKKLLSEEEDEDEGMKVSGAAHIKISSRKDGKNNQEDSLVVSMDINGIMYQGVLFAQTTRSRSS